MAGRDSDTVVVPAWALPDDNTRTDVGRRIMPG